MCVVVYWDNKELKTVVLKDYEDVKMWKQIVKIPLPAKVIRFENKAILIENWQQV